MNGVRLSAEAAAIANQIRSIDREVDRVEARVREYLVMGLRSGGLNQEQRALDYRERDQLLARRAVLAKRLKDLTEAR